MHLEWLMQLCFMWQAIEIAKTHQGEMLPKENTFQLQKHPAVNRYAGEVIKNISKICYNHNDTHDDETAVMVTAAYDRNNDNNTANILNIFTNILQQTQLTECQPIEETARKGDFPAEKSERQSGVQVFSILQQLKLDEEKYKREQEMQKQQLKLQQQQNALKLQQILQQINAESLAKAGKKTKKKKKKKKKKKRKKQKPVKNKKKKQKPNSSLLAHPAQILFASATQKPLHHYQQHDEDDHHHFQQAIKKKTTTTKPLLQHPLIPIKKIKYILRKNTIFKKKKKEYLNHLKHVLYPFVKFIAFFTILNPFTLAVFLFSLVSPVVFGFLGFIGLSFFIKPALNFLFGIKHTVSAIRRRKLQQLRRRQRLRNSRRPITIHKHYYQQQPSSLPHRHYAASFPPPAPVPVPVPAPPPPRLLLKPKAPLRYPVTPGNSHYHPHRTPHVALFNPLLPDVRQRIKVNSHFMPNIKGHNDSFEEL